jgi:hypothetical protein
MERVDVLRGEECSDVRRREGRAAFGDDLVQDMLAQPPPRGDETFIVFGSRLRDSAFGAPAPDDPEELDHGARKDAEVEIEQEGIGVAQFVQRPRLAAGYQSRRRHAGRGSGGWRR